MEQGGDDLGADDNEHDGPDEDAGRGLLPPGLLRRINSTRRAQGAASESEKQAVVAEGAGMLRAAGGLLARVQDHLLDLLEPLPDGVPVIDGLSELQRITAVSRMFSSHIRGHFGGATELWHVMSSRPWLHVSQSADNDRGGGGGGVAGGIGKGKGRRRRRRYYDMVVCACVLDTVRSIISEFEVLSDLVPGTVGPFFGRLVELACLTDPGAENEKAWAMEILLNVAWVPNCRRLFVPFEHQLRLTATPMPESSVFDRWVPGPIALRLLVPQLVQAPSPRMYNEILTCFANLGPVLPQFVDDLCDTFVSQVAKVSEICPKTHFMLDWLSGWDTLAIHSSKDVVEFLQNSNVTSRITSALLQYCERVSLKESHTEFNLTSCEFIERILSKLSMLCFVDPMNGHKVILQFIKNHIKRKNQNLKAISSLLIIPVILTGGSVDESIVMQALTSATADDAPRILQIMFSLRQVFVRLSHSSVACLFEKALERHRRGFDGFLFQMLKFCAVQIRDLPQFGDSLLELASNSDQEEPKSRKRSMDSRVTSTFQELVIYSSPAMYGVGRRKESQFQMRILSVTLDHESIFTSLILVASSAPSSMKRSSVVQLLEEHIFAKESSGYSRLNRFIESCFYSQAQCVSKENEQFILSLLKRITNRSAFMQEVLDKCQSDNQSWALPLLKALLIYELLLVPGQPRKLPSALAPPNFKDDGKERRQEVQLFRKSLSLVMTWLLVEKNTHLEVDSDKKLVTFCEIEPAVMKFAVQGGDFRLVKNLLQFCMPGQIPSDLIVDAVECGFRDIAELLLCNGVSIPEEMKTSLKIQGEMVDTGRRSLARFFNRTPTWDPQQHQMFPWWFKVRILRTVLLCWLRNATMSLSKAGQEQQRPDLGEKSAEHKGHDSPHQIGTLPEATVHHILLFLSPVHWF
ncbi:hypothetical protein Pelo_5296 [Pelomyxa schiedti]|nr:hypothetical protein Pelo_5296 [Pelomyxa schiedti]